MYPYITFQKTCLLAIQGPNAKKKIQPYCTQNIQNLVNYTFIKTTCMDVPNVLISCTGYTGAGGVEIYFENINDNATKIWNILVNQLQIQPIGLAARDTLRIEKGYCLYGNDIDDTTNPLEAGLGWITKLNTNFIGSEILQTIKLNGIQKKLVGFKMIEKGIPRSHYNILNTNGKIIGQVTSGTHSPSLNLGIGLGYVEKEYAKENNIIYIDIRKTSIKATVTKLPFL